MHDNLRKVFEKTVEIFRDDPRVLGGWVTGSAHGKSEDKYSDVDPMFIINDEDFESFDANLKPVFESITDEVVLWWPERGNNDVLRNYAIFFKAPELHQYDINIMKASIFSSGWMMERTPDQILFDKTGLLTDALQNVPAPSYSPDKLLYNIELFWVYAYIITKYLLRKQNFKLAYTQSVFLETHMEVLHALNPDVIWDWWPINAYRYFDKEKQEQLHRYFKASDAESISAVLMDEIDDFTTDARSACERWNIQYPERMDEEVRKFIDESGCLT
ncbi:MAG: aminoglycoside 6-adenylyltransferase [Armatimonadota bacterium]